MLINLVHVFIKPECLAEFLAATRLNHEGSRRENGNRRFDVVQAKDDPNHFVLYEVFESAEAIDHHRQTPHYHAWKKTVEPMMAKPRESAMHLPVFPDQDAAW